MPDDNPDPSCICPDDNTRVGNCPVHAPQQNNVQDVQLNLRGISANGRDCEHGQLARSCEICELEENLCDANLAKEEAYQAGVRFGQRTTQRAYEIAIERGWLVKTVEHPVTLGESPDEE